MEAEVEALKGNHFVNLNYQMYNPKKVMCAHFKKTKFKWSYSHTRQDHEDEVKNWYNATRELIPNEK